MPVKPELEVSERSLRMAYVDGFLAAVPTANREKFRAHAELAAQVFKDAARSRSSSAGATMSRTAR